MAADWSQLPKELLHLISERLDSPLYLLRFRSVCSAWRSSASSPSVHHFPFNLPPLSDHNAASTFFLSKCAFFLITPPPHPHQQTQTQNPWLVKMGIHLNGKTRLWHPLFHEPDFPSFSCVFDLYHHPVFHLGNEFIIYSPNRLFKAAAAKEPVLLIIHDSQNLALIRCREGSWSVIPDIPRSYHDVCAFNGRLYAVDSTGRTVSVGSDLALDLVAEPVSSGGKKFLVESEGMLLLLVEHMSYIEFDERVVGFDLFSLDKKEKKWVEMTSLGDRVLFLGGHSCFSASASDLCVGRGNSVVFIDHALPGGLGVFHFDEGQISLLSEHPCYSRLFWPPLFRFMTS